MDRNRTTQVFAVITMLACLLGAGLLVPPINQQRKDLQLEAGDEMGQSLPPHVALATAALGSFRGLVVDILWYRANELKEAGKFYEANTLSQWITTLQPRFPQVWAFHAWNMAYNISVATHTPEERWDWVNKGIRLLRERGIPLNPRAIRLYRELSWIFFHKIGQSSDDMHWYYKRKLAFEMQEVLGDLDRGGTTEEIIARFRSIADAPTTEAALVEQAPETRAVIDKCRALGYELDAKLLRQFGRILMFVTSLDAQLLGLRGPQAKIPPGIDPRLVRDIINNEKIVRGVGPLLSYLRHKVLIDEYRMDPGEMLRMMEDFGPMDWRHSASHGAYWARIGTERAAELRNKTDIDLINTYRQNVHSLQSLTREGKLVFDPVSEHLDILPDPRFIPAYEKNIETAEQAYFESTGQHTDSYESGHENFLLQAVLYCYLYGDEAQAQQYYDKLRDLYGAKLHNLMNGRYTQPLEMLVLSEFTENKDMRDRTRQFIDAMISRALVEGLANNNRRTYLRYLKLAKALHTEFQQRAVATAIAPQDRMKLLSWEETLDNTFIAYMQQSGIPPLLRARVWINAPEDLRRRTYLKLRDVVQPQFAEAGLNPELALPAPQGMEDAQPPQPEEKPETREQGPARIQRK